MHLTLWFPVGICKDLFEDSNKGEGGVLYLPISLYHVHIITYTCTRCTSTKMISRDLKLYRDKYSYWHILEQSMNNVTRDKETERERDSTLIPAFIVHIYTRAHFLTQSQTHSLPNTQEECVCVRACTPMLVLLFKRRAVSELVSLLVPWPDIRVQIRQTSKEVVVQRCGLTSDLKVSPRPVHETTPTKSVLVD